jgi:hypothetical protein
MPRRRCEVGHESKEKSMLSRRLSASRNQLSDFLVELGPGERFIPSDFAEELALLRRIVVAGVRHDGQAVGQLVKSSGDDEVLITIWSPWPARIINAAVDSYLTVRTLIGRLDNSLAASRKLIYHVAGEPLSDRACSRLDQEWQAEHRELTRLEEQPDTFREVAEEYHARKALLEDYLNTLFDATGGRYGIDPRPDASRRGRA